MELNPEFKKPHEWVRDEEGFVVMYEMGDYHDGPECLVCGLVECRNCEPKLWTEPCAIQDEPLMPAHKLMTEIQQKQRFKELYDAGWIMRNGLVVGHKDKKINKR